MAKFEIEANGKRYEVEAPDQASAIKALGALTAPAAPVTPVASAPAAPTPIPMPDPMVADIPAAQPPGDGRIPILSDLNDASHAFTTGAMEGMTLGFADELTAGVETPFRVIGDMATGRGFDPGRAYGEALEGSQEYMQSEKARNPMAATAGDITGAVINPVNKLSMLSGATSIPSAIVRGAADGAIYGGISGFGRAEGGFDDRIKEAQSGALLGAGFGGVTGGVAGAIMRKAAKAAVPTVDELKDQARALYDKADASGVTFPKSEVKQAADDIAATAISDGIDPTLHPKATAALKRLAEAADTGMTVKNAQTMRRIIAAAAKDPMNPDEARIVSRMIDKFDDMVAGKAPDLATARGIYHQAKKGELIEQAIELARVRAGQYSNGGMENALRTEFRELARKIVKGQLKGLSQEEVDAINKVAEGGAVENILRWVGKAAPTGIVSAGLSTGVPFAIGNAIAGPGAGALAAGGTMAAGIVGKSAAGALTGKNAIAAALLARGGGKVPAGLLASPGQKAAFGALAVGGGNETPMVAKKVPIEIMVKGGNRSLVP